MVSALVNTGANVGGNSRRIGKTLEIAVFKALREGLSNDRGVPFVGGFQGLDDSDEETWRQIEPPSMISGRALSGDTKLDFILFHPTAGPAAMEVKNTREWMHPDKDLMLELLRKSCELDAVPVMICRRYAYVTFSVLHRCGVLLHQNYNQLLPEAMRDVAEQAKNKDLLGYHDIRLGTEPDSRLRRFVGRQLQSLLPEARERFDEYKDLLWEFACGEIDYKEFAGRSRRREQGVPEDFDQDDGHEFDHY